MVARSSSRRPNQGRRAVLQLPPTGIDVRPLTKLCSSLAVGTDREQRGACRSDGRADKGATVGASVCATGDAPPLLTAANERPRVLHAVAITNAPSPPTLRKIH
jgi:hypothetical protein